ncbi:MAG: NUDIX hydrolase [Parvularculaceae bacterium]
MNEGDPKIKIGIGAVVFRGDDVLIIRRGKPPFMGQWSIPGGSLHYGEKLEDAVRREVREETAIEIRIGGLIGVFEATPDLTGGDLHVVMADYWADWLAGEPVAGDDAAAAEFVSCDEALARVSWDETRRAVASALKLRNRVKEMP